MAKAVQWVSSNLRIEKEALDLDAIPSTEAFFMYLWARENETEFRRVYDSRRIPAKGLGGEKDAGFVDDGKPIDDIIGRIKAGLPDKNLKKELQNVNAV